MNSIAGGCVLTLLMAIPVVVTATQLDPCTLLTAAEINAALGRKDVAAGKSMRETDDVDVCLFGSSSAGDVVIVLPRVSVKTQRDFELLRDKAALTDLAKRIVDRLRAVR